MTLLKEKRYSEEDITMGRTKHLDQLKRFKDSLKSDVPVDRMILFGSRARGTATRWSDFDILIVSKKCEGVKFRYRPLGFHKHWNLDYPVDFLCYSPQEFKQLKRRVSLVQEAVKEGVEI